MSRLLMNATLIVVMSVNETATPKTQDNAKSSSLRPRQNKVKANNIKQDQEGSYTNQTNIIVTHHCIFSYAVVTQVVILKKML